jgi:hypothetical protein
VLAAAGRRVPARCSAGFWTNSSDVDGNPDTGSPKAGGATRVPLEPAFLFSKELLQAAIPELLSQTGTTGGSLRTC